MDREFEMEENDNGGIENTDTDSKKDPTAETDNKKALTEPLWFAPEILSPLPGAIVRPGFTIYAGTYFDEYPSAWELQVMWPNGQKNYTFGRQPNPWTFQFTVPIGLVPPGEFWFRLDYKSGLIWSAWGYSGDLEMLKLPVPIIDQPKEGTTHLANVRITGTGVPGAYVDLLDFNGNFLAKSSLIGASTRWEINYPWSPGPKDIRVIQSSGLAASDRTSVRSFRIKPGKPVITQPPNPAAAKQVLTLTNIHDGAVSLRMFKYSVGEIAGTFNGTGTTRTFTPAADWAPGTTTVNMEQIVNAVASDPSDTRTVFVRMPLPGIDKPAYLESTIPTPTASGTGLVGATVTLRVVDNVVLTTTVKADGTWSGVTSALPPGPCAMPVVQTMNGVSSDANGVVRNFKVKPLKPAITQHPNPVPANQALTVTGIHAGTVILKMFRESGAEVAGTFSTTGTTRTFTPAADWAPGSNRVYAVQTVNSAASDPSDIRTFFVKPPKPAITPPPNPAPANQVLTVTGIHAGTVTLKMFRESGAEVTGTFSTTGTTRTFTPAADWAPGSNRVYAVQTVNCVASDPSDIRTFTVKPPVPGIDKPAYNDLTIPTPSAEGTGLAGATVTLWVSGNVVLTTTVKADRSWSGVTSALPPGPCAMSVVQTMNGESSDANGLVRNFRVKPPKPAITQPPNPAPANQVLTVTGVHAGTVTLKMFRQGGAEVTGIFSATGTTRNFTPVAGWGPGAHSVYAVQTVNTVASDPSDTRNFSVKPPKPAITQPPNPAPANQVLTVTNIHAGAVILKMFKQGGAEVVGTFSATGTTRTFKPVADWTPGPNSVYAVQTVNPVASDPGDTRTFAVKPPKPAITQPPSPAPANQALTVTGVHEGIVTLTMFKQGGAEVVGTFIGTGQIRTFTPAADWAPGANSVYAVQTVNFVASDPGDTRTFAVKPPKPAITQPPNPAPGNQALTVTGIHAGTVTLKMFREGGAEVAGTFSTTGTSRIFTPAADWPPGGNSVYTVQTVNFVASDPSDLLTFVVQAEDIPEQPKITLPVAYYETPTRPFLEVIGLPGALITVRLDEGEVLCTEHADAEGVMQYRLTKSLEPGDHSIDAKQEASELESEWSASHPFTVKNLPKNPTIDFPRHGSTAPRKLNIRGTGETRGQIQIRHEKDGEDDAFAEIKGLRSWRWDAQEPWPLGNYTILARQEEDGDSSSWTDARSFEVIETRYAVGDAQPALGQPVAGTGQSARLRVQIVTGDTGEAAAGVTVQWRISGQPQVIATSVTNSQGWTEHIFTPDTAGEFEVLADLTKENGDVVIVQPFTVKALLIDDWEQKGELKLDGKPIDLSTGSFALLSGQPHELEFSLKDGHSLDGASITLDDLWQGVESGVRSDPELGTSQVVETGKPVRWVIKGESSQTAYFGLVLKSPPLTDRELPGHVIGTNLNEEVEVFLDRFKQSFGKETAYPCLGATHIFSVKPGADSTLLGKHVTLLLSDEATALGVIVTPPPGIPVKLDGAGLYWTIDCANSETIGSFAIRLHIQEWDFSSGHLPMLLGHNKVQITEISGPLQTGSGDWRYGIRATSFFTKQGAGGVPVNIWISGEVPRQGITENSGWVYVIYKDGASASLNIYNRYDGSYG
jgi:hypothetical protein